MCAQVHDGVVRLFPYIVLGGGNAAGYALKELLAPGGVPGKDVCLVRAPIDHHGKIGSINFRLGI